jgi:reductive dehalogenase
LNAIEKYQQLLVGPIERFDQRNDVFRRVRREPALIRWRQAFDDARPAPHKPGYSHEDYALTSASWYLEDRFAMGLAGSNHEGLYSWTGPVAEMFSEKIDVSDPVGLTKKVKKVARLFGASLVGICELDRLWLYSHVTNDVSGEHTPLEIPPEYRYAIAIAVEMDYALVQTSPAGGSSAATGLAYSKMAFVAGLLAQFIRGLGFQAIPCGNDTALSIPIAIEAGLGELGRNGLLITESFGPRVRLCKVFTDLPLVADEPRFFGVEAFCRVCLKCAEQCPSRAIPTGERSTDVPTLSNNPGVLKWTINPEQCFRFWGSNRTDCSNCIRVCPFNQKRGWHHDLVRTAVRNAPWLDPLLLWLADLLGYGHQHDPAGVWGD